jgi:hypothetical protein
MNHVIVNIDDGESTIVNECDSDECDEESLSDDSSSSSLSVIKDDCIQDADDEIDLYCPIIKDADIDTEYFEYLTKYIKTNIDLEKTNLTIVTKLTGIVKHGDIKTINGFRFSDYTSLSDDLYYCDYCKAACNSNKSYYCYDCYKDMCETCYNKIIEKDTLDKCRKHKIFRTLDRIHTYCNGCQDVNPYLKSHYNFEDYDLCDKCYNTIEYENKSKMVKTGDLNFGSLRGWFNIVTDLVTYDEYDAFCSIICNLDKNSKYYKSFGVSISDDGCHNHWNLNYQDIDTLVNDINNTISYKYVDKSDNESDKYETNSDKNKYKNCSTIQIMASLKNIKLYY